MSADSSKEVLTNKEAGSGKEGGKIDRVKKSKNKRRSEKASCNGCEEVQEPLLRQSGTAEDAAECRLKEDGEILSSTVEVTKRKKKKKHHPENLPGGNGVVAREAAGEDASKEKVKKKKRKNLELDEKMANCKRQKLDLEAQPPVEKHSKVKKSRKITCS